MLLYLWLLPYSSRFTRGIHKWKLNTIILFERKWKFLLINRCSENRQIKWKVIALANSCRTFQLNWLLFYNYFNSNSRYRNWHVMMLGARESIKRRSTNMKQPAVKHVCRFSSTSHEHLQDINLPNETQLFQVNKVYLLRRSRREYFKGNHFGIYNPWNLLKGVLIFRWHRASKLMEQNLLV